VLPPGKKRTKCEALAGCPANQFLRSGER